MRIPTSYNKLTVRQFLKCVDICKQGLPDHEENCAIAAYLSGMSQNGFESLPYYRSVWMVNRVKQLKTSQPSKKARKYLFVKGRLYRTVTDIEKFSASRGLWIDSRTAMHERAAVLLQPVFKMKLTEQGVYPDQKLDKWLRLSEVILDMKVSQISGVVFFWLNRWRNSAPRLATCTRRALQTIDRHMKESGQAQPGTTSPKVTDGITT